ncbi:hypothetical protein W97_03516 [Coniosporium apollinis CBS 100218]|uniref:Uncharacterized protein n=1 Tax=Coniosporium apollinis (strain CBS 100218) TaxID=1168221 RepID=R7YQT5_CONA1|nr:uncharacterized protein W97_03516 [Coniosporium apollinis CBS 100218]EON64285.1 hypothetical protein W97_03516 [Coniosporium apollinis CBS 100218]
MTTPSSTLAPISPITAAAPAQSLTTALSVPAINSTPVELDGTPTSPSAPSHQRDLATATTTFSPTDDELLEALDGAAPGVRQREREKREREQEARRRDPAVLVDIPQEPRAEELEAAEAGAGAGEGSGSGAGEMTGAAGVA